MRNLTNKELKMCQASHSNLASDEHTSWASAARPVITGPTPPSDPGKTRTGRDSAVDEEVDCTDITASECTLREEMDIGNGNRRHIL